MNKRRLTLAGGEQPGPYRATTSPASTPLLTLDRAIADNLCPASLRQVAARNAGKGARQDAQARNLYWIADRLELLGYGRKAAA